MKNNKIIITVISGSDRKNSKTNMAAKIAVGIFRGMEGNEVDYFDPLSLRLPFPGEDKYERNVEELNRSLKKADGIILATPEYNGNISAALKLFLENFDWDEIKGKPYNFVGVASSRYGATKSIESVKCSCNHEGGVILPGSVSIGSAGHKFDADGNLLDEEILARLRRMAESMIEYIRLRS